MVKIKAISVKYADQNGEPLINSFTGKEQASIGIKIDEPRYAERWLNNYCSPNDPQTQWKKGDEVEITVTEKNGKLNFKPTKASPAIIQGFQKGAGIQPTMPSMPTSGVAQIQIPADKEYAKTHAEKMQSQLDRIEEMVKEIHGQLINPL